MTKELAIQQIEFIKSNRQDENIHGALNEIKTFVENQDEYDRVKTNHYIDTLMPTKMGGVYIEIGKSLRWLKQSLKIQHKT